MIIVDKPMPTKCAGCWAMRCSKCIISDSKNIMEYQSNGTKPAWCPVKEDADKIVISLENELEYTRDMGNDECYNCGFNDEDYGCTCPHSDKWYACPIENKKPENIQALKEYAEWLTQYEGEWVAGSEEV